MTDISTRRQARVIFETSMNWFFAGFDLILVPLLSVEVGRSFFPNIDPVHTILTVYGVFSLSLLARVFGGIFFGRIADTRGEKPVITICLFFVSSLMVISAFLPGVFQSSIPSMNYVLEVPILFIFVRTTIGFFIGGLWPTAAIRGMNLLYDKSLEAFVSAEQEKYEKVVKKRTIQSGFMQVGFHAGHLVAAVIFLSLLVASIPMNGHTFFWFKDAIIWRYMCFGGGIVGLVWSMLSIRFLERINKKIDTKKSGLKALLNSEQYRKILFNFWLILTGLMYMYYSTIVILPEMLLRNHIFFTVYPHPLRLPYDSYPLVTLLILTATLGAHIWLGFFCRNAWAKGYEFKVGTIQPFVLMERLRKGYLELTKWLWSKIGFEYPEEKPEGKDSQMSPDSGSSATGGINAAEQEEIKRHGVIDANIDLMMIALIAMVLIVLGFTGIVVFYILFQSAGYALILVIVMVIPTIMVANSGWALIPSLLSSRFPLHLRNTASSLAYNGGLVIGFASPFITLEYFLSFKNESVIFIPMILGAFAMLIGAARLINSQKEKTAEDKASSNSPIVRSAWYLGWIVVIAITVIIMTVVWSNSIFPSSQAKNQYIANLHLINVIKIGNSAYQVKYEISKGGRLMGIDPEIDNKTLRLSMSSTSNGNLTIQLPRKIIDSKTRDQHDSSFSVFEDGEDVTPVNEITSNSDRTLTIDFKGGTFVIEIVGTIMSTPSNQSSTTTTQTTTPGQLSAGGEIVPNTNQPTTTTSNTPTSAGNATSITSTAGNQPNISSSAVSALVNKGAALDNLGNYTQAIRYYDRSLAINPRDKYTLDRLAADLETLGNWTRAIKYAEKALAMDPNDTSASTTKTLALNGLKNTAASHR